jgi:hypothetical protein
MMTDVGCHPIISTFSGHISSNSNNTVPLLTKSDPFASDQQHMNFSTSFYKLLGFINST